MVYGAGFPYQKITLIGILVIIAGCLVGIVVPAGLGWDFANFYDAGHKVLVGQINDLYDPYALIGSHEPQGNMKFLGTPLSSYLYVPMALLAPETALVAFKIQNTLALGAALLILFFYTRGLVGRFLVFCGG